MAQTLSLRFVGNQQKAILGDGAATARPSGHQTAAGGLERETRIRSGVPLRIKFRIPQNEF